MKKRFIYLAFIFAFVFSLAGCSKGSSLDKSLIATPDQLEDLEKDLEDIFDELHDQDVISFEFVSEAKADYVGRENIQVGKTKTTGSAKYDIENPEDSSIQANVSYEYTSTYYDAVAGKVSTSYKYEKEEIVVKEKTYRHVKETEKGNESTYEEETWKRYDEYYPSISFNSYLSYLTLSTFMNADYVVVDGDNITAVYSTYESHREITIVLEGDEIVSLSVYSLSNGMEENLEVTFVDSVSISKPDNASDYELVD